MKFNHIADNSINYASVMKHWQNLQTRMHQWASQISGTVHIVTYHGWEEVTPFMTPWREDKQKMQVGTPFPDNTLCVFSSAWSNLDPFP